MKKEYFAPTLTDIRLNCATFLALSGGGKGSEGDDAESRRFWGVLDEEDDDTAEPSFF
ncbi:MAG: hypothetical protein J6X27_04795 [Bacteroidaceae bacterium]|nr:hypothetical protein [Bacteroidaceae bacterium]